MPAENSGGMSNKGGNLCPMCRRPLKPNSFFCTGCGHRIGEPPKAAVQPSVNPELLKYQQQSASLEEPEPKGKRVKKKKAAPPSEAAAFFKEFQKKYFIFIGVSIFFILLGAGLFLWQNSRSPHLEYPVQMEETEDGIFISSTKMIAKYTSDGDLEWKLDKAGQGRDFSGRLDFSFGPDGNLYIANTDHGVIEIVSPDGKWTGAMGKGTLGAQFTLAFLKDGRIAVADTLNHAVVVFTAGGEVEARLGGAAGSGAEQFNFPSGIAQLPDGLIHVVDSGNQRMQRIDLQFIFRDSWDLSLRAGSTPRRGGMIKSIKNAIFKSAFFPKRILFDPVRDHVHICYGPGITAFPTDESFIVRLDKNGQFVESVDLSAPGGGPLNPQRLRRALQDKIALVDPKAFIAGSWDPASNFFEPVFNPGVSMELERMKDAHGTVRAVRGVGAFLLILGVLGLAALGALAFKEYGGHRGGGAATAGSAHPAL